MATDMSVAPDEVDDIKEILSELILRSTEEAVSNSKTQNTLDDDLDDDDVDIHIDSIDNTIHSQSNFQSSPYSLSHIHSQSISAQPISSIRHNIPSLQRQIGGIDIDSPGLINGINTLDYDLNQLRDEDKPWRKPGADITDYFNYGFNEESWTLYCIKQRRLRAENQQLTAVVQNTAVLNASGLMAQVFRGNKSSMSSSRRQGPTNIDVIGATDETSRRQAAAVVLAAAASQNAKVPDMSTPPPGYGSNTSITPAMSAALSQLTGQQRHSNSGTQNVSSNNRNFIQPPTTLQLQQQFAAALASVRFPTRPGTNSASHRMPSGSQRNPRPSNPSNAGPMWENPNAPKNEEERNSSVDRKRERSKGESYGNRHDDRKSGSPRSRYEHRYHRRRGRSPTERRRDSPYRRRYNSRHHPRSPIGSRGASIRRRDSSGSDVQRRSNRRHYKGSPTNAQPSLKHKRKSRSPKSRSVSTRRIASRQRNSHSRSRSRRKDENENS